ncbi:helix-turn-helix domain-containing protein [Oceaniovalibus sp. ACAM 378]|uniref:helix-turn-helix domain-containing protein n=1 Tax=Oceaniovalibus sp. ACAM 378 TaxID=2599923 RepID=UPI0021045E98|nr:cupin domain-containing protein [Oceaniovalibus sp. ACAM 378]
MLHSDPANRPGLGADLRTLRRGRGMTLAIVAGKLGKSVGWLSQVERDLSAPSVADLRELAALFGVPVSLLFGQAEAAANEVGHVVRSGARRRIGSTQAGLVEELLSPDLTDDFEMVHSTFAAGASIETPVSRPTQEVGYIVSGRLDLWIDGQVHRLQAGDSFRVRGEPFRWMNPYDTPAVAIWVIAPPVY